MRPSAPCHRGFGLATDRSPGFGSAPDDSTRCSHSLSLRLRHRLRLAAQGNSQTHYAKGTQSPRKGLLQFGGARVQVLFHSPRGVLFTFPSRYWFAIGRRLVFSLGGWAPRIQAGFHVTRPTWDPGGLGRGCAHGAVTLCGGPFQALALAAPPPSPGPATPPGRPGGLGIVRVRSPLLAESPLSSLPPATEMFHFAGSRARRHMGSGGGAPLAGGGLPHSDTPGSKAACASPGLFAACRVLHRLPPPRHPPRARTAWTPEFGARPALRAVQTQGVCCLTKKRRCAAEIMPPRTPYSRRNESAPRGGRAARGTFSTWREAARIPARNARSRASFPVRCQRSQAGGRRRRSNGGRTWTRTMDLVLIRDAL